MNLIRNIRTSFTNQLTLWVAGFVLVTSGMVLWLLVSFLEGVIRDETVDATLQALENTALRIDNTLRQSEMTARLEGRQLRVNRSRVERLIDESGSLELLRQSLPNAQLFVTRRDSSQLDLYITGGESGYRQLVHEGREMFIFSQPLGERQFCIAAMCPVEDIYGKYAGMHLTLLGWGIGGVLVLLVVLYFVIARHLRPLHLLAEAAQSIAGGNLDTPIPDSHHEHETGRLQSSLKKMQRSLRAYMDEMQQKRATLSAQNAELQAANGEAMAYEAMKAKFLKEMTAEMAAPVELVCRSTDTICNDYAHLSRQDMVALQTNILSGTESIVELLDLLLRDEVKVKSEEFASAIQSDMGTANSGKYAFAIQSDEEKANSERFAAVSTFPFSLFQYIQHRLSLRLGLLIVFIITVAFTLLFGYLFFRNKRYVQRVAIDRATQLLDNTAEHINGIMDETETVTNFMAQTTPRHLSPDSLLVFTHRTVAENPFLTGFAISMEPYFFPEMGRYYSAYSLRYRPSENTGGADAKTAADSDSITTVREGPFEYFDAVWYKTPRSLGRSCWVDAFDDYNEGTLSCPDIMISYCCPMRDAQGRYVGSITASLTLKWLSQAVSALKPYPNSSAIMIGRDGTYLVHPDTAKLFRETIFSDAAPESSRQIVAMGKDMLAGHSGMEQTIVDDVPAFIFYRPLERTGWSIAIVCPERDIFARYNHLVVSVWVIIAVGLMLLMLFCYQTVRRAAQPLTQLDHAVRRIADGHFDEPLPESSRRDSVGRLTNSFITMQQSLAESVADIRRVNAELQQQNDELAQAYQLKLETSRKKAAFIQEMYHEIRTPLNIISGFTQVLTASLHNLPAVEEADITARMKESAADISRLTRKLAQTSIDKEPQL